jgi:kynurenine formamidase
MKSEPNSRSGLSAAQFDELVAELSNWGRWGDDDELGTLHHLNETMVLDACALVRQGRQVSLGRPLDTVAGPDNTKPALHYMTNLADTGTGEPKASTDFVGVDFHGKSASHLDALPHMSYKGRLYNGRASTSVVTSKGSAFAPVSMLAGGIVARGVLLDAARARGTDWIEPPDALLGEDLAETADRLGVEVRRGDAVLIRSGQIARRTALGAWNPDEASVGLHPDGLAWLAEREIALLGGDGDSDARPSAVEGVSSPIHVLALVALGMCLLDNLDLEALGAACAESGAYEFLVVVAPLIVPGGTGSPVNPIAVL